MKENKVRERMNKYGTWGHETMKDYKGYHIWKTTKKEIGKIDEVWYEVHGTPKKFETLKDAKEWVKEQCAKTERYEKALKEYKKALAELKKAEYHLNAKG